MEDSFFFFLIPVKDNWLSKAKIVPMHCGILNIHRTKMYEKIP